MARQLKLNKEFNNCDESKIYLSNKKSFKYRNKRNNP